MEFTDTQEAILPPLSREREFDPPIPNVITWEIGSLPHTDLASLLSLISSYLRVVAYPHAASPHMLAPVVLSSSTTSLYCPLPPSPLPHYVSRPSTPPSYDTQSPPPFPIPPSTTHHIVPSSSR